VTNRRGALIRLGDEVRFQGRAYRIGGLEGDTAYLTEGTGGPAAVTLSTLFSDADFEVLSPGAGRRPLAQSGLLDRLPNDVQHRARWWENHVTEVLAGRPCVTPDAAARPEYDVTVRSLRQREQAKVQELQANGEQVTLRGLQRLRRRYETEGVIGLVDKRLIRQTPATGRVDERVVTALLRVLEANTDRSSGTRERLRREVRQELDREHGPGQVPVPSKATFNRLVNRLAEGRHATGSARTRRTLSQQPDGPFGAVFPVRPGELTQIDSTPLDVAVLLDDGVVGRVELTALVDVATRSVPAAVLRPTTKAVDAALLLARCMTPEPMRPGWPEAVSMAFSALPFQAMRSIDQRLENAAARPVLVPETIVFDHGKAYLSNTFRSACRTLGISLQPAHPDTPTDKPVIERTLQSVGTLFAQHVAGYLGSSVERRGKDAEQQAVFSLVELQDLLDEWIVTGWQNRPHEGLRDPLSPGQVLTPNEKYAALLGVAGYVPVPLSADDYIELLPMQARAINSYGVKINHRVYDAEALNPYRGQPSGVAALKNLWEVHHDPYDVTRVWVRNHHDPAGGWITLFWRQLASAPVPFGDDAWNHARRIVADRGVTGPSEEAIAEAVDDLLTRASGAPATSATPGKSTKRRGRKQTAKDRRVAARTKATAQSPKPTPTPETPSPAAVAADDHGPEDDSTGATLENEENTESTAEVIPLRIFDAHEEAKRWW
jgi:transposase InsO family protein